MKQVWKSQRRIKVQVEFSCENLKELNLITKINRYLLQFFVKESFLMNPEIKLCRIHLIFLKFVVKVVDNYSKVKVEHLKSL